MMRLICKALLPVIVLFAALFTALLAQADNKRILVVSAQHSNKARVSLLKDIAGKDNISVDHIPEKKLGNMAGAEATFSRYDAIIFDAVSEHITQKTYAKYQPLVQRGSAVFLAIKAPALSALQNHITTEQATALFHYYDNGGIENFKRMSQYLRYNVLANDARHVASPIIFPAIGIYHPDAQALTFASLEQYQQWRPFNNKPVIGLMIQRSAIEAAQTSAIDSTIKALEQRGASVVAFFYELSPKVSDYGSLIQKNQQTVVDVIINFRTIHWANQRKREFERWDVPVMQALTYYDGNQQDWENSSQGISVNMTPFLLVLPETAGVIDPIIIAAVDKTSGEVHIIDYQLEHLINRALNYAALKHKPNHEKKLTVMFWGDQDMGASFLNVPASLRAISARLHNEGYRVNAVDEAYFTDRVNDILSPFYRNYQLPQLLEKDLADTLPLSQYRQWFSTLPGSVQQRITNFWGEPEQNFMVVEQQGENVFVIPRIRNGNMLIMRQPPRGDNADQDRQLYHKGTVPMNHYYLAAYYYARQYWNSDSIIHLGTHGSQEYLPGKERGLSRYDGGNLAVGDTPVMYPFIVDDVGEAMQTKRRGSAVVVSHMTPPYAAAGLQGATADMHALMHEYRALDEGGVKQKTAAQIVQTCIDTHICKDFNWTPEKINANFMQFLAELHDYLAELAAENQPLGLHTFGELPTSEQQISTLVQMLGNTFKTLANGAEARQYTGYPQHEHEHEHEHEHDKKSEHATHKSPDNRHFQGSGANLEDIAGFKTVRNFILNAGDSNPLDDELRSYIIQGQAYYNNMQNIQELDNLVKGLAGNYVPVKTGGDPVRHPDSLPTGLNLYGFDPSRLPTKAAFAQGKELVEQVIADHYQENGHYPDKLAFSLWSIEAMRHYGVLEAQAMYAMGIRPVWSEDGRVVDTEIIPASELKRPRVDVVLSATGLYRDAFPNVIQLLAKAIEKITQLKEQNNSLWDNSQRIRANLVAEGIDPQQAQYLSSVRIFSNASGDYGSGVSGPVSSSDSWDDDAKIADNYLYRMGFAFGSDPARWGERVDGLYARQLSGTDIALFSRSSTLYGMITSDDPFEYFGSLALAVRHLDGASAKMLISNLRDVNNAKMDNAATFLARELRSRNFNKRWIQAMQQEGYSGAVTMSSNLSNFWGWQVVDPGLVRADQWQDFFDIYVDDKYALGVNEWFEQVNPAAQAHMIQRMLEAVRKQYWQAGANTQQRMIERLLELMNQFDLYIDNEKLIEFTNQQAAGFGLNGRLLTPGNKVNSGVKTENISGQKLEKVEPAQSNDSERDLTWLITVLICGLFVIAGAWYQSRVQPAMVQHGY